MKLSLKLFLLIITIPIYSYSQSIDQDHTGTGTNYLSCEEANTNAQSFTAGLTGNLNEIRVDIEANVCPFNASLDTIAFIANIYDNDSASGTLLATQNIVLNIPYSRSLFPITFTNPAPIVAGQQYTVELRVNPGQICDPPFISINFIWYSSATNDYSGGQPYSTFSSSITGDLYFQTYVTTATGTYSDLSKNSLSFYPNPVHDLISLSGNNLNITSFKIIGIDGRVLIDQQGDNSNLISKDISFLKQGIYMLVINAGEDQRTCRFIKD